ncbi:MAG: site-specific DNA-methyltransferase [Planctomycetes bacterium]|nr:site-specific DNA-methyltransferase [Planctomycetota bacterium]
MEDTLNTIVSGDCIAGMNALPEGSVDLAFADPPFNIGYEYDVYDDKLERDQYLSWSRDWISAVHRILKSDGVFWLAIGDEYAAQLKLASQDIGFHCRSWVIWYYTFGVNCTQKFSRSHAHLFHFVKDPQNFTFRADDMENRIPSARQLVYNDKRANSKGRLPDDTWIIRPADVVGEMIDDEGLWSPDDLAPPSDNDQTWTLRPQDLDACFKPSEDTWYFPRVAGTFKERAGFHGCQMPEQLLGRIIRYCSNDGEVVLDPFAGSATTLAVAKKLGRKYLGFDISDEYIKHGTTRLESIRVGDPLDGSSEPLVSAPKTGAKSKSKLKQIAAATAGDDITERKVTDRRFTEAQLELTLLGVKEAFRRSHEGFSADFVVADPNLNSSFSSACDRLGIVGGIQSWNKLLFRLRKSGKLADIETTHRFSVSWSDCDDYLFASEIALEILLENGQAKSLDDILCQPEVAGEFDAIASRFAPGYKPVEYRWAALKLRKQAKLARSRAGVFKSLKIERFGKRVSIDDLDELDLPEERGVYLVSGGKSKNLYAGETLNLRTRLSRQFGDPQLEEWRKQSKKVKVQAFRLASPASEMLAMQSCLITEYHPKLNFRELRSAI